MELVFLGRKREDIAKQQLMVAAMRLDGKKLRAAFQDYVRHAFPYVNLEDEEKRSREALHKELEEIGNTAIVFRPPQDAIRNAPQGPGREVLSALGANLKRKREQSRAQAPAQALPHRFTGGS
jgi:hypothetical protein